MKLHCDELEERITALAKQKQHLLAFPTTPKLISGLNETISNKKYKKPNESRNSDYANRKENKKSCSITRKSTGKINNKAAMGSLSK